MGVGEEKYGEAQARPTSTSARRRLFLPILCRSVSMMLHFVPYQASNNHNHAAANRKLGCRLVALAVTSSLLPVLHPSALANRSHERTHNNLTHLHLLNAPHYFTSMPSLVQRIESVACFDSAMDVSWLVVCASHGPPCRWLQTHAALHISTKRHVVIFTLHTCRSLRKTLCL